MLSIIVIGRNEREHLKRLVSSFQFLRDKWNDVQTIQEWLKVRRTVALTQRLSSSDTVRWQEWDRAITHIQEHPMTGYGLGVSMIKLDRRLPEWIQFDTHNAFLGIWLQIGFVGLALVVALYVIALKTAASLLLSRGLDKKLRDIIILPARLLVVLLIAGLFEENLTSRGSLQQILWALCVALNANVRRIASQEARK